MSKTNPLLAVVIYEAYAQGDDLSGAILRAAVQAWYEGHVAGEGDKKAERVATDQPMPSPPFPSRDDPGLAGIIKQTRELFTSDELRPAAVSYVSGLAYAAGFAEGVRCGGCSYRGDNPDLAAAFRAGQKPIWLFQGVASDHVRVPAAENNRQRYQDLAKRLCAAWISRRQGLSAVDYTYRQMKKDDIGDYWVALAAMVEQEMSTGIVEALMGPRAVEDPGDSH